MITFYPYKKIFADSEYNIVFSNIIKFINKLYLRISQAIADLVDFIVLLNFRGSKSPHSQEVIRSVLLAVCKKAIVTRLYGGMAILFSTGVLILILGILSTHIFLRFPFTLSAFLIASLIALSLIFIRVLLIPLISLLNREKIALLIERKYPSLNNSLISSIQLTKDKARKKAVGYSEQMIRMLVDETAKQIRHVDVHYIVNKIFLRLSGVILILSIVIFSTIYVLNRSYVHKSIPVLFSYFGKDKGIDGKGLSVYAGPVLGDITLVYRYPLYTGLPPKTLYNTSGDIRAFKGSEVQISALSDRPLRSAEIIFNDSINIPLLIENEKTIKGSLSLFENGSYVFQTTDSKGRVFRDIVPHAVQVDSDQFPEISVSSPGNDTTVHEKDTVEIKYTAKDDFGIHEIALVFEQAGEKKSKAITNFSKKQIQYGGAYMWSLSELNLQPEDKIAYHLEVKDNDTISGPKTGSSKTYYLEIYSSRKKHQELIQMQEALLQATLHMLSDDLTKRIDDERCASKDYLAMIQDGIQGHGKKIDGLFTDILLGMRDDTLANYSIYYSLENLQKKFRNVTDKKQTAVLNTIRDTGEGSIPLSTLGELQKVQDEEVAEVENIILFLNDMIEKQKLEDALDTGKNLVQSQSNIEKLLDKLREGKDEKLNEKVLSELKRVEETIQQMMEKLMKMAQAEHMDEFLNADALKKLEQNNLAEELNAMKDAMNKGDLDSALKAAQRMLSSLQDMMNQMRSSMQNFADSSFGDMLKNTNQLSDKIAALETKERELTENTDTLKKDIQQRASEAMKETLQSFFEKQAQRVEAIKKDLAESKGVMAENKLLQKYLQVNRDLKRMSEERETFAGRFSELFGGEEEVDEFQKDSEKLSNLFKENAELNREINKEPMQRNFLYMSRELPQIEERMSHLEEMLKGWEAKESLDLAREMLQNMSQINNRMRNALEQKKAGEPPELSKKDMEIAEKVKDATNQNLEIIKDLEAMMQSLEEQQRSGLTEEDRTTLQKYAEKQKDLKKEAEKLTEMADKLSRQNPFMDKDADQQLDMASQSMGKAKEQLEKHDAQGATIDERESLYRLAQARKGMEMAKERIAQGMMGGGMPMPIPRPFRGKKDEGQFGASTEKVEIPSEEAYKVPKEFREDILNALKEGLPEKYKELNKDYYQRLVD